MFQQPEQAKLRMLAHFANTYPAVCLLERGYSELLAGLLGVAIALKLGYKIFWRIRRRIGSQLPHRLRRFSFAGVPIVPSAIQSPFWAG
jgi:hypothetical protein